MKTIYVLGMCFPADDYDTKSTGYSIEAIYDNQEEAIKAKTELNFRLRKEKTSNAEHVFYTINKEYLLKRFKP